MSVTWMSVTMFYDAAYGTVAYALTARPLLTRSITRSLAATQPVICSLGPRRALTARLLLPHSSRDSHRPQGCKCFAPRALPGYLRRPAASTPRALCLCPRQLVPPLGRYQATVSVHAGLLPRRGHHQRRPCRRRIRSAAAAGRRCCCCRGKPVSCARPALAGRLRSATS